MVRFTTDAVPDDLDLQYRETAGTNTVSVACSQMQAIRLGDLVENTDFFWNEDMTFHEDLSSASWTPSASITVGDGVSDWKVFWCVQDHVNTTSNSIRVRLDVGGTPKGLLDYEGEDSQENWCIGGMVCLPALAADTDITVEMQTDSASPGLHDVERVALIAIRLDSFEDHFISETSPNVAIDAVDTDIIVETVTHTVDTSKIEDWSLNTMGIRPVTEDTKKLEYFLNDDTLGAEIVGNDTKALVSNGNADIQGALLIGEIPGVADAFGWDIDFVVREEDDIDPEDLITDVWMCGHTFSLAPRSDMRVGPTKTSKRVASYDDTFDDRDVAHIVDVGTTLVVFNLICRGDETHQNHLDSTITWDSPGVNESLKRIHLPARVGKTNNDPYIQTWALLNPTAKSANMRMLMSVGDWNGNVVVHITNYIGTETSHLGGAIRFVGKAENLSDQTECHIGLRGSSENLLHAVAAYKGTDTAPLPITELSWATISTNYYETLATANWSSHLASSPGGTAITWSATGSDPDENNMGVMFEIMPPESNKVGHVVRIEETPITTQSGAYTTESYENSSTPKVEGWELEGSTDYILIARIGFGGDNTSLNDYEMRIAEDGVGELTGSHVRIEPRRADLDKYQSHLYIRKVTTAATPNDYQVEFKSLTTFAHIAGSELIMIKLDDLGSGDWAYDNDAVDNSFVAGVWEDGASITIGNGTSDWLIINTAHWQIDSASADDCKGRIDVDGTPVAFYQLEAEDAVEELVFGTFHYAAALAADTVVKNEFTNTAGAQDVLDNSIFALRLNAFADHAGDRNTDTTTIDAISTTVQPITLTHTVDVPRDHEPWAAFASTLIGNLSTNALRTSSSIRDDTDVDFVGNDDTSASANQLIQCASSDTVPCLRIGEITEPDATDLDWDLSVEGEWANTGDCDEQILVGFTWELAEQ